MWEYLLLSGTTLFPLPLLVKRLAEATPLIKIVAFFGAWVSLWLPIAIPLSMWLRWQPPRPLTVTQKLSLVLSLYALAPILLVGSARIQSLPFANYGWVINGAFLQSLALGLAWGVLGVVVLVGLESWFGWRIWQAAQWQQIVSSVLITLVLGLFVSGVEELVFRGFLLNQLRQEYGIWLAAIASSVIFALLHLVWDGWQAAPQLPGLWLMGMVLVLTRWVDHGSLGLACGLHAGWIWGMASLDSAQLTRQTGHGAEWLTGQAGSPLAGLMGILLLLLTGLGVWGLTIG